MTQTFANSHKKNQHSNVIIFKTKMHNNLHFEHYYINYVMLIGFFRLKTI